MSRAQRSGADSAPASSRPHIPVLLDEVLANLEPNDGGQFIDGTFGAGGYSRAILAAAATRVLAIECDPAAWQAGQQMAAESDARLQVVHGRFGDMSRLAAEAGCADVDGVVLDIGVSSMQLDQPERGFSFMADGPLDMRMGSDGSTAADLLADLGETEIADILFHYGEERRSRAVARAIVRTRDDAPIRTTRALVQIVEKTLGRARGDDKHPATRTFQALRIAVNDELGELARGLAAAEALLKPGGRLVVVTFHSLEDRIVKRFLARRSGRIAGLSRHGPPATAVAEQPSFRIVNQRPLTPSQGEIAANPRARSAKLRAAIRASAPAFSPETPDALGLPPIA